AGAERVVLADRRNPHRRGRENKGLSDCIVPGPVPGVCVFVLAFSGAPLPLWGGAGLIPRCNPREGVPSPGRTVTPHPNPLPQGEREPSQSASLTISRPRSSSPGAPDRLRAEARRRGRRRYRLPRGLP